MTFSRGFSLTLCLISISVLSACSGAGNVNTTPQPSSANVAEKNAPRTNVEELGLLVKVPYEAEDIVWKEFPASKKVMAALRFSTADANKIVADAESLAPPEAVTIPVETWFPEELVAQGENSGDSELRGRAYRADAFFQEPYTSGRIIRIEGTDFFVLEVTAK
jgi:hypothetical protein